MDCMACELNERLGDGVDPNAAAAARAATAIRASLLPRLRAAGVMAR